MKITLTKSIKVKQYIFIGEVDFFKTDSPYIKLLEHINSEKDLRTELDKKMPQAAIQNVIKKLEELNVLKDGHIEEQNIKNGFPDREYGKYSIDIFQNNTKQPFEYKNKNIERKKADLSNNNNNNIVRNITNLLEITKDKDNKEHKVIAVEKDMAYINNKNNSNLQIIYYKKWHYVLGGKNFSMKEIDFIDVFEGKWNKESKALMIDFNKAKEKKLLEDMEYSYTIDNLYIDKYGLFEAKFTNIPVIPKTPEDAKLWFLHLLKNEIKKKDRYISKEELQSLWSNIMNYKPKFQKFNLKFDIDSILKQFGKNSKYYWLLQASIDLYPFANNSAPKSRVIIEKNNDADLKKDLFTKFNIAKPQKLIIVDRWIVNLGQFQALEKIIEAFDNPKTTIVTQAIKENYNKELINKIIQKKNIIKYEKYKKDIVHQRYWIIDDKYYITSESLDFITIKKDNIQTKYTTFELYEQQDINPDLLKMEIN